MSAARRKLNQLARVYGYLPPARRRTYLRIWVAALVAFALYAAWRIDDLRVRVRKLEQVQERSR